MLKNFINTGIIALKYNLIYNDYDRESKNKKISGRKGRRLEALLIIFYFEVHSGVSIAKY